MARIRDGMLLLALVAGTLAALPSATPGRPAPRPAPPTPTPRPAPRRLPTVAVPPATAPARATTGPNSRPASRPAWQAIPKSQLLEMYQRDLGPQYNPADADKVYAVHGLLEDYFDVTAKVERKAIVGRIRGSGLDANLVGRLCRLRMYWPQLDGGGVYYVNERVGPHFVRYFFGVPRGYDRTRPWPLLIKLAPAGPFLADPPPDADGVVKMYAGWMKEELDHHPDAVVVMPLLNLGEMYGPSYVGMNTVIQPMLHVADRVNVDPTKVYLLGHSEGAHAAWNLALHYTTYFASFEALAGGASADWQRLRVVNLKNVLPVVWHDADDAVVSVKASQGIVKALRAQKVDVEYEETKGVGHAPDAATAERQYDRMRARARDLYPADESLQSNRRDTMFNRLDWLQVWEPITGGKERDLFFRHGSGKMTLFANTFRIDATRKGNRFDITTQNVDGFRLFLNDQMVDFTQPVTVVLNKKPIHEALMTPDVEVMLQDQVFLGRGWRYYTAGFDIEVVNHPKWTPPATKPATRPTTAPATRPAGRVIVGPSRE